MWCPQKIRQTKADSLCQCSVCCNTLAITEHFDRKLYKYHSSSVRQTSRCIALTNGACLAHYLMVSNIQSHGRASNTTRYNLPSIPPAVSLSWLKNAYARKFFWRAILAHKVGDTDLVFGMRSAFISRSVYGLLQVSVWSGYNLCQAG